MKISTLVMCASMGIAVLGTIGCDVFLGGRAREDRVYVQQQPQYVEAEPQYVVVDQAPPAVIVEQRGIAPSPSHVWIGGYYVVENKQYRWQPGRYEVPPQAGVVWIAPRYDEKAHRYTVGQWSKPNGNGHEHG